MSNLRIYPKRLFYHFSDSIIKLIEHDGIEHAGYMAFMFLLSIFPFLIFLCSVASLIGETQLGEKFVQILLTSMPQNVSFALRPRLYEIITNPKETPLNIAVIGIIWTSSSAIEGLRTIFNRIYEVSNPPIYVFRRLLSICQFLLSIFLLILGMFFFIFMPVILQKIHHVTFLNIKITEIWHSAGYVFIFLNLFIVVFFLYYTIPNARLKPKELLPGTFIVVIFWILGARILSIYFEKFEQLNLIYGSLGGLVACLIYFYVMNIILIYGAEFNKSLKSSLTPLLSN